MSDQHEKIEIEKVFAAGDAWLMKYGVVSPIMHNNIVLVLYSQFPKIKFIEYFITPQEEEDRAIKVVLYLNTWRCLFTNTRKLIENVESVLEEYLYDYEITVQIRRHKKGMKSVQ